jgi:hypothetical protein
MICNASTGQKNGLLARCGASCSNLPSSANLLLVTRHGIKPVVARSCVGQCTQTDPFRTGCFNLSRLALDLLRAQKTKLTGLVTICEPTTARPSGLFYVLMDFPISVYKIVFAFCCCCRRFFASPSLFLYYPEMGKK